MSERFCEWKFMDNRTCCQRAVAVWYMQNSRMVCKKHAKEVERMGMGLLAPLPPQPQPEARP